ncbi:MAG: glycoside hydrolase family 3 N-terminal domain-containing protein [Chitinophagaceae bacterium]
MALFTANTGSAQSNSPKIYHKGWIDFNKNNKKDLFEDPTQPVELRINDLLSQMTLEEKTAQLATLYGYGRVLKDELPTTAWKSKIWKDGIGNIDEHLNSTTFRPQTNTKYSYPYSRHAGAINQVQKWFVEETRLGIPVDFTNEAVHGLANEKATSLPSPIGMGSTWNKELLHKAGTVIGREARALGYTNVYVPILDLARDPRWGRVVECYGEDPFLVAELGKQLVLGVQKEKAAATLKHYAVYSVPKGGRDGNARTDPHVAPRELHQMYLYPFRRVVEEASPMGVMASYNDWDGTPIISSYYFLTELLRKQYGFTGYVVSDSEAVEFVNTKHKVADSYKEAVRQVVEAGLNVRTNFDAPDKYILPIRELVNEGKLNISTVNQRVADVLRVKFKLGLFDQPYVADTAKADQIVNNADAKQFAKQINRESLVLLKNTNNLLPLNPKNLKNVLITGPLAIEKNHSMSRYGPSNINVIDVLEGIKSYLGPGVKVNYAKGCEVADENWPESEILPTNITEFEQSRIDSAVQLATQADVIIAVMGETEMQIGESRSRTNLDLTGRQLPLLKALYATGKPIVLVLINGQPLTINWPTKYLPSILEAWFPGAEGGTVIAEALFGAYNPGGKLPVTFPKTTGQLELNFPFKPGSHAGQPGDGPNGFGKTNVYGTLYPFGHGLSYTTFSYSNLQLNPEVQTTTGDIQVTVEITNSGKLKGDEVVQLYLKDEVSSVTVYETQLRGFQRVTLEPGDKKTVQFVLKSDDLKLLDKDMKWLVEPGTFEVQIGSSSEDIRLKKKFSIQ